MELAKLSAEVIGEILSYKHSSYLVIGLWKCGDSQLNHKLAVGVHYLRLKDTRIDSTSRYPKLIFKLKALRHLDISRGKWPLMGSPDDLRRELQSLSGASLATLRISSGDAGASLQTFNEVQRQELGLKSRLWDLGQYFPLLTSLKISTGVETESDISEKDFAGLPSTLTHLNTPILILRDLEYRFCATLPRSLQVWRVKCKIAASTPIVPKLPVSDVFWDDPPPNLEMIRSGFQLQEYMPTTFEGLPKTLRDCWLFLRSTDWPASLYQSLPPHFKNLCNGSPVDMQLFPSTTDYSAWKTPLQIEHLHFHHGADLPIPAAFIASLPSTLHTISQPSNTKSYFVWEEVKVAVENASLSSIPFWPRNLTSLELGDAPVPYDVFTYFPPTLKILGVTWTHPTLPSDAMPRHLGSFVLSQSSPVASLRFLPGLPETLDTVLISDYTEVIFDEPFPSSITELYADGRGPDSSIGEPTHLLLPTRLTKAYLTNWKTIWFSQLPSSLTDINVQSLKCCDTISLDDDLDYFESLPSGLKNLSLGSEFNHKCSAPHRIFAHLTELHKLEIRELVHCDPTVLPHLPSTLRSLEISLNSIDEENAKFLSPSLQWLAVSIQPSNHPILMKYWPPLATNYLSSPIVIENRKKLAERASLYPDPRTLELYSSQ